MIEPIEARAVLARCGIRPGEDFHALSAAAVQVLIVEADARKYRKPRNASGSRGRYFHAYLNRQAARST